MAVQFADDCNREATVPHSTFGRQNASGAAAAAASVWLLKGETLAKYSFTLYTFFRTNCIRDNTTERGRQLPLEEIRGGFS